MLFVLVVPKIKSEALDTDASDVNVGAVLMQKDEQNIDREGNFGSKDSTVRV